MILFLLLIFLLTCLLFYLQIQSKNQNENFPIFLFLKMLDKLNLLICFFLINFDICLVEKFANHCYIWNFALKSMVRGQWLIHKRELERK